MNKLILICLGIFVFSTVNVAIAETGLGQKAKQTGLNTASQNQMLTQKLGTELIVKSSRLIIATYDFDKFGATSGTFTFKEKGTGNVAKIPKCHAMSSLAGSAIIVSTPKTVVVSGGSGNMDFSASGSTIVDDFAGGTFFPAIGTDVGYPATVDNGVATCSGDSILTGTITSGTITSGQLDLVIETIPYSQTP